MKKIRSELLEVIPDYLVEKVFRLADGEHLGELTREDLADANIPKEKRADILRIISTHFRRTGEVESMLSQLPTMIAQPLHEVHGNGDPRIRLWSACELLETVLRFAFFLGIAGVVESLSEDRLPRELLRKLYGRIEEPTLGAWLHIAKATAEHTTQLDSSLFPELEPLVDTAAEILNGGVPRSHRNEKNALIAVRNAFAHGGGCTRERASNLLGRWLPRVEALIQSNPWLKELDVFVVQMDDSRLLLQGLEAQVHPLGDNEGMTPGQVMVRRGNRSLSLAPLLIFDIPRLSEDETVGQAVPQAYNRTGPVRPLFTPLGHAPILQGLSSAAVASAFYELFDFGEIKHKAKARRYTVTGFESEILRDASGFVGRADEEQKLWTTITEAEKGIYWIPGPAGIGKSYLMAHLTRLLIEEAKARRREPDSQKWLILPYRFRGNDDRCRLDRFVRYLVERLERWDELAPLEEREEHSYQGLAEDQKLTNLLQRVAPNRAFILVDGLDEIDRIDRRVVDRILPLLNGNGIVLACFGRSNRRFSAALKEGGQVHLPLPGGVSPMGKEDIRALLFARLAPRAVRHLILGDQEVDDGKLTNSFVNQVAENAAGLPIYVEYIVNDILAGRLRYLDAVEAGQLPPSLAEYFGAFVSRYQLNDSDAVRPLVAATLALAEEPLSVSTVAALIQRQGFVLENREATVENALASLGGMVLADRTPTHDVRYRLYHESLRTYLHENDRFSGTLATMQRVLVEGAHDPATDAASKYLFRNGVRHLIDASTLSSACALLSDFDYLMQRLKALKESGPESVEGIDEDWRLLSESAPSQLSHIEWSIFWSRTAHILRRGDTDWPCYKLLLQVALGEQKSSAVGAAARNWMDDHEDVLWPFWYAIPLNETAQSIQPTRVITKHKEAISGLSLWRGDKFLSYGEDGTLHVWDQQGNHEQQLLDLPVAIQDVATIDNGIIVAKSADGMCFLIGPNGEPVQRLEPHTASFEAVFADPVTGWIYAWSNSGKLSTFDATRQNYCHYEEHYGRVVNGIVAPGQGLFFCTADGRSGFVHPETGQIHIAGQADGVDGLGDYARTVTRISETLFATSTGDRSVIYALGKRGQLTQYVNYDHDFRGFLGTGGNSFLAWDIINLFYFADPFERATAYKLDSEETIMWVGARHLRDGTTALWGGQMGVGALYKWSEQEGPILVGGPHRGAIKGVLDAGDSLLSWAEDGTICHWRDEEPFVYEAHHGMIEDLLMLGQTTFLSWSTDGTIRLWDTNELNGAPRKVAVEARDAQHSKTALPSEQATGSNPHRVTMVKRMYTEMSLHSFESSSQEGYRVHFVNEDLKNYSSGVAYIYGPSGDEPLERIDKCDIDAVVSGIMPIGANHFLLWTDAGEVWKIVNSTLSRVGHFRHEFMGANDLGAGKIAFWTWPHHLYILTETHDTVIEEPVRFIDGVIVTLEPLDSDFLLRVKGRPDMLVKRFNTPR